MYFIWNVLSFHNFINFTYNSVLVSQCYLFNYCKYLTKPSEYFNLKATFAILLPRIFALKDKSFRKMFQVICPEKANSATLNHTVKSTGTAHEIRHYTEKIRAKFIWLLNCCFPGQAQCFLSSNEITWFSPQKTETKQKISFT